MEEVRPSPLSLAVLGLLAGGPLHPYRIQLLIKEWGKDQVINVGQRANLYKAIKRLHQADLIAIRQTERDQQYPERTVYELTDEGMRTALEWLTQMLSTPRNEFPQFPAALSFAMLLGPENTKAALEKRADALRLSAEGFDRELDQNSDSLPRVVLIETEYQRAMVSAELTWVTKILDELASGKLIWSAEDFATAEAYLLD